MVKQIEPTDNGVMLSVSGHTDVGMHRSGNEDAFLIADLTTGNVGLGPDVQTHQIGARGSLLVVSDGMGGAVAGEIASELAVETIKESLMEMPGDFNAPDKLKMAAEIANERIWSHARENPELTGMGATLTAVLVHSTVAYIAQVGDSRAYLIRGNRIKQITKDQSLAQMLIDSGAITPDQAHSVPQNVIMQALGTQPTVKVAMSAVQLCRNDHILLCSDGLSGEMPDPEEIAARIKEYEDLTSLCHSLIETANERGGKDNITVVVARFDGEALHSTSESATITGSFLAITTDESRKSAAVTKPLESAAPDSAVSYASTDRLEQPAAEDDDFDKPGVTEYLSADVLIPGFANSSSLVEPVAASDGEETTPLQEPVVLYQADPPQPQSDIQNPTPVAVRKQSYAGIIIIGLISILMIAAATYFYFVYYLQNRPSQPSNNPEIEQPAQPDQQPSEAPKTGVTEEQKPEGQKPEGQKPETAPPSQSSDQAEPQSSSPPNSNN